METFFSDNIRILRKAFGFTQSKLADVLGVSSASVAHYETGKNKPSFDGLLRLCELFEVTLDILILMKLHANHVKKAHANFKKAKENQENKMFHFYLLQVSSSSNIENVTARDISVKNSFNSSAQLSAKGAAELLKKKLKKLERENIELQGQVKLLKEMLNERNA